MTGEPCRTCGTTLTREGCPNRIAHARAYLEQHGPPSRLGEPSKPGKTDWVKRAVNAVHDCRTPENAERVDKIIRDLKALNAPA